MHPLALNKLVKCIMQKNITIYYITDSQVFVRWEEIGRGRGRALTILGGKVKVEWRFSSLKGMPYQDV